MKLQREMAAPTADVCTAPTPAGIESPAGIETPAATEPRTETATETAAPVSRSTEVGTHAATPIAPAPEIVVRLDGRPCPVPHGTTLAGLVASLGHAPNAVSTAVNGLFVARAERATRVLQPDDAVVLFQPIVGG
jgi:sulfur carrier protein